MRCIANRGQSGEYVLHSNMFVIHQPTKIGWIWNSFVIKVIESDLVFWHFFSPKLLKSLRMFSSQLYSNSVNCKWDEPPKLYVFIYMTTLTHIHIHVIRCCVSNRLIWFHSRLHCCEWINMPNRIYSRVKRQKQNKASLLRDYVTNDLERLYYYY